ncbi:uncharacterized protein EI90DRAFT_2410518 [Cantharellus anzutake]|uniref:uncharacterized protein n=1 Tax=Cantharellus anzutake TaxID=1750568 RepID=UPI001905876B|nr:uncharacterized protein EI90DRAFT_2410518 [Cantharellus anzutake]KAF8338760.1 hypothetical protein EI90DRAFT_2410518 [Cantharellus anzutake]
MNLNDTTAYAYDSRNGNPGNNRATLYHDAIDSFDPSHQRRHSGRHSAFHNPYYGRSGNYYHNAGRNPEPTTVEQPSNPDIHNSGHGHFLNRQSRTSGHERNYQEPHGDISSRRHSRYSSRYSGSSSNLGSSTSYLSFERDDPARFHSRTNSVNTYPSESRTSHSSQSDWHSYDDGDDVLYRGDRTQSYRNEYDDNRSVPSTYFSGGSYTSHQPYQQSPSRSPSNGYYHSPSVPDSHSRSSAQQ